MQCAAIECLKLRVNMVLTKQCLSERCDVSNAAAQTATHAGTVSMQCSTAAAQGLLALVRACAHYTQLQCALIRPFYS
eukprot:776-Heterococcus_DN1.PRE.1